MVNDISDEFSKHNLRLERSQKLGVKGFYCAVLVTLFRKMVQTKNHGLFHTAKPRRFRSSRPRAPTPNRHNDPHVRTREDGR